MTRNIHTMTTMTTPATGPEELVTIDRAPLAQLAEQLTLNQRVQGSSPWRCTTKGTRFARDDPEGTAEAHDGGRRQPPPH